MTFTESRLLQATVTKKNPYVIAGDGIKITVKDPYTGEVSEMIDGCTGAAVGSLGHGDPDILEEIVKASKECVYSFPLAMTNEYAEELADYLIERSPKGAFKAAIFTGSGSESNDNALKIIYQYHVERNDAKRVKFISRQKSYHGYTLGAMAISGSRTSPFEPILLSAKQTPKVGTVYRYREQRDGETEEQYKDRLLEELEEAFIAAGPDTVAAFITETVSGSTVGTEPPLPGYLEGARAICHKYGALFMLDEVMCGMSRCGAFHAWEKYLPLDDESSGAVGPDIQSIGKTLGSGFVTIAGVLISPKVRDTIANGSNSIPGAQTYHSHAFNTRIALAVQKKIAKLDLTANIEEVGSYMGQLLKEKIPKVSKFCGDVRGSGGFWSVEFVKDRTTKEKFAVEDDFAHIVGRVAFKNGLSVMALCGAGEVGDHVTLSPSYIITKADAEAIVDLLAKSIVEAEELFLSQ